MSVLIRDMEMPQNCSECAFCGYYSNKEHMCDIIEKAIEYENAKTNRRDDCPLIELPQHGRLIDADKITEHKYTTIPPRWFFGSDSTEIGYCYLLKGELPMPDGVPQDCPLVPVPSHGRLIDADAFLALINDSTILSDFLKCIIKPLIRGEPTVIEAEEGE